MSEAPTIDIAAEDAWHGVQRSWTGLLTVYVVLAGVFAVNLAEAVRDLLGNSLLEIGIACGGVALIATLGVVMFYVLGTRSRIYQRYDVVETIAVQLVLNGLIYFSDQRISPVWAFWMLHTCLSGASTFSPRVALAVAPAHFGLPILQGVLHFAAGDVPGAALALTMTLAGSMGFTYGLSFMARMRALTADRERLTRELGQMHLAEDRRRIARDLHDGLGAELAAIAWRTSALAQRPGSEALAADLRALTARAASGIDEIRSVVWAADAAERRWSDVVAYLRGRARELAPEEQLLIEDHGEDVLLPGPFTAHYVRFVLEAMRNAVGHGHGAVVRVRLAIGTNVEAEIENALAAGDGPRAQVGSGLANLAARARALGGSASIGPRGAAFVVSLSAPRPSGVAAPAPTGAA